MKENISRLYLILQWLGRITFAVLFCIVQISAQQGQQPIEFPIGAFLSEEPGQGVLASFDTSGLNTVSWRANGNTSSFLENYKVWANNGGWTDWIHYYATCYYSRWEGEQDTTIEHIGVKHKYGQRTVWQDTVTCWSSLGVTAPVCSLMYGPHYRQDQRYKSYYHTGDIWGVDYVPRFNMALDNPYSLDSTRNICVIKVVYRYAEIDPSIPPPNNYTVHDTIFLKDTLKIADFPQDSSFKIFNVWQNNNYYYRYPEKFQSAITGDRVTMSPTYPDLPDPPVTEYIYSDHNDDNGIQFWVDYLGNDSTTLFIDWAEVYDNRGWNYYIEDPQIVEDSIQAYTQRYSAWDNIIYWYGQDEPYSQDSFAPIRIIDSLVQHFGGAPVTQYFQPDWHIVVNGDTFMVDYYRKAKPPELIIDPYPFGPVYYPVRVEDLESLRQEFQIASSLKPGFWFIGQGFGEEKNGEPYLWRRPDPEELLASIMISLAHGVKGIVFWNYDSYSTVGGIYVIGIVDENGSPSNLWYLIHDNLVPRLKGKIGRTLLGLDYTGNYLQLKYTQPTQPVPVTWDYLTLGIGQPAEDMNWHAGFLKDSLYFDNNYFLLANLWTIAQKSINVKVTEPVPGYENYSFRNVESGYLDTTFTGEITTQLTYPAGEGYLFQVAPVLKYGGKIIENDTVTASSNLIDNMTIRDGATVTINDGKLYTAMDTIKLEGTGFISGEGYFDKGSSGWVILDSWDYSVFKGREGDHPKIIWSKHPTVANILDFKVYRDKGTSGWVPIKTLSNNVYEYIDSAVTIIEGDTTQNEVAAKYFVIARYFQGMILKSDSSNTITYWRVEGGSWEKRGTGTTKILYTYSLSQNYPNPFNPSTTIEYSLEKDGDVEIEILDILGRKVKTLVNEHQQRGHHSVNFNASNLSSGVYLYRIMSGKFVQTRKMILMK